MDLNNFHNGVFFSTLRITIPEKDGKGSSIGTGFLFNLPLGDELPGMNALLIISNKHVLGDGSSPIFLNFHKANNESPVLGETISIAEKEFKSAYYTHPDSDIDLACVNFSGVLRKGLPVFYRALFPDILSDFSESDLSPGMDIFFIGYPENRFDTVNNLPILRKGVIASIPTLDFNGKKQFLIDAQVFPGSSGSPVFAPLGGKFKMIGVVTQTMIKHEQLQAVPTATTIGVNQTLGLGIILKSILVKELISFAKGEIIKEVSAGRAL